MSTIQNKGDPGEVDEQKPEDVSNDIASEDEDTHDIQTSYELGEVVIYTGRTYPSLIGFKGIVIDNPKKRKFFTVKKTMTVKVYFPEYQNQNQNKIIDCNIDELIRANDPSTFILSQTPDKTIEQNKQDLKDVLQKKSIDPSDKIVKLLESVANTHLRNTIKRSTPTIDNMYTQYIDIQDDLKHGLSIKGLNHMIDNVITYKIFGYAFNCIDSEDVFNYSSMNNISLPEQWKNLFQQITDNTELEKPPDAIVLTKPESSKLTKVQQFKKQIGINIDEPDEEQLVNIALKVGDIAVAAVNEVIKEKDSKLVVRVMNIKIEGYINLLRKRDKDKKKDADMFEKYTSSYKHLKLVADTVLYAKEQGKNYEELKNIAGLAFLGSYYYYNKLSKKSIEDIVKDAISKLDAISKEEAEVNDPTNPSKFILTNAWRTMKKEIPDEEEAARKENAEEKVTKETTKKMSNVVGTKTQREEAEATVARAAAKEAAAAEKAAAEKAAAAKMEKARATAMGIKDWAVEAREAEKAAREARATAEEKASEAERKAAAAEEAAVQMATEMVAKEARGADAAADAAKEALQKAQEAVNKASEAVREAGEAKKEAKRVFGERAAATQEAAVVKAAAAMVERRTEEERVAAEAEVAAKAEKTAAQKAVQRAAIAEARAARAEETEVFRLKNKDIDKWNRMEKAAEAARTRKETAEKNLEAARQTLNQARAKAMQANEEEVKAKQDMLKVTYNMSLSEAEKAMAGDVAARKEAKMVEARKLANSEEAAAREELRVAEEMEARAAEGVKQLWPYQTRAEAARRATARRAAGVTLPRDVVGGEAEKDKLLHTAIFKHNTKPYSNNYHNAKTKKKKNKNPRYRSPKKRNPIKKK